MRQLYTLILYLTLPLVLLRLLWRSIWAPAYRSRWPERFGRFQPPEKRQGIWVHAVSVGEVLAIQPLVRYLQDRHPEYPITVTTTTPTGSDQVRRLFNHDVFHVYFPYDMPATLDGFLDRVKPRLLVMVETEIWPNLLYVCEQRGIPTLMANGRLSERSARGYARLGEFSRSTFRRINEIAAQAQPDAERFIGLGTPAERVQVTGSIKFDMTIPASVQEQAQVMRRLWGEGRPVWVAASTHEGEEEQMLEAHAYLRKQLPKALLVLVPRHPDRFDRVAAMCRRRGLTTVRRSSGEACTDETVVYLGDTMGELPIFLGAADAAFFGGSLVNVGGHNMLEAAAQGVPVLFGPHVFNFFAISALILEQQAGAQVNNSEELGDVLCSWLLDASERSRLGENGRQMVAENRGALEKLLGLLEQVLQRLN